MSRGESMTIKVRRCELTEPAEADPYGTTQDAESERGPTESFCGTLTARLKGRGHTLGQGQRPGHHGSGQPVLLQPVGELLSQTASGMDCRQKIRSLTLYFGSTRWAQAGATMVPICGQ